MTVAVRENFNWWALQRGTLNATVTEDLTKKLEGRASAKCKEGEASRYQYTLPTSKIVLGSYLYYRVAVFISAKPAANEGVMRFRDSAGTLGELTFRTSGKFNFFNSVKAINVGGESPEATLNEWYFLEVKINVAAAGNSKIGWRILNKDGSTFFAEQFAEQEFRNNGVKEAWSGHMGTGFFNIWLDKFGINDSKGSINNSWLGASDPPVAAGVSSRGAYQGAAMDGDVALLEGKVERGDAPYVYETWDIFEEHQKRPVGIVHFSDPWKTVAEGGPKWDGFGAGAAQRCYDRGAIACKTLGSDGLVVTRTNLSTRPNSEAAQMLTTSGKWTNTRALAAFEGVTGLTPLPTGTAAAWADKSVLVEATDTNVGYLSPVAFPGAGTYVVSMYCFLPANWNGGNIEPSATAYTGATSKVLSTALSSKKGEWQRIAIEVTVKAEDLTGNIIFRTSAYPTVGRALYLTGALVETGAAVGTYFPTTNQTTSGQAAWTGTANASTSTLQENTIWRVLNGDYDAQLKTYFKKAAEFKRPFFFRLWWEMNGNWWVWSQVPPASYIEAWQRVYNIAQEQGATNATFFWCPNIVYGAEDPEQWYPGDKYVHWVGFDGYNGEHPKKKQGWRTAGALLGPTYERLLEIAPGKPIAIGEIGCSEYKTEINNVGNKAPWLEELYATIEKEFPGICAVIYYNEYAEHGGGRVDWPIESYPDAESTSKVTREAFAKAVGDSYYFGPVAKTLRDLEPVPPPVTISRVAVRQTYVPDKLAVRIDAPGGSSARWADDELNPENVLGNITIEDEMPGGYKQLGGQLARNPQLQWDDTETYGRVKAYLPGVEKVFEGSIDKTPQSSGDERSIRPEAVGDQRFLEDNNHVIFGIIDCDLSKWGDASLQRKKNMLAALRIFANAAINSGFKDLGSIAAGLIVEISQWNAAVGSQTAESWYYGGGVDIGALMYDFNVIKAAGTSSLVNQAYLSMDDILSSTPAVSANYINTETLNQKISTSVSGVKYALLHFLWTLAGAGENSGDSWAWTNLKVLGTHGLTPKGTWPNIGFTAKQIHEYAVPLFTPLQVFPEDIDDDNFVIPQAWYDTPGSLADAIRDYTKYSLFDWFVFNDQRFKFKRPGSYGRFWKCRLGETEPEEDGLDGSRLWESIVVQFNDVSGRTITVGPPGSNATITSEALRIVDPDHPAVRAKRTRRDVLDLRGVGTPATAIAVGERFLEEANLLPRSGSAKITGWAMDSKSVMRPVSQIKSGDYVSFVDAHDSSYRKIVHRSYDHNDKAADIDFDAPPTGLEQLLERLQAGLVSRGVG